MESLIKTMAVSVLTAKIDPAHHLNLLVLLGIAVFGGTIGAKIFQKLRIPQVVGYIVIGILLGGSVLNLINIKVVESLTQFNIFALGITGFMIGGELKGEVFKKYGKQFLIIMLSEGLFAFAIVTVLTTAGAYFFLHNWHSSLALGLVLGAISSATAPAATVDVLWEYKTRGILTRTVLAIVALDNGLALLLYGFASSIAGTLLATGGGWVSGICEPLWEIAGAIILGLTAGLILVFIFKRVEEPEKVLTFIIASVMLIIGLSIVLKVESILAAMVLGATLINFLPRRSQNVFKIVEKFSPPIYVLFFVLVGARLEITNAPVWVISLAVIYVIGRSAGKISGSWFGARISKSPAPIRKYLGMCLFSQAGVAVGLSILASQNFSGEMGQAIIMIITVTTFLIQIIGPPMVKLGVKKAGEVGLNVTEDDLIKMYKVNNVMDTRTPAISAGTSLNEVIKIVSETDSFYYGVVDSNNRLIGKITLTGIRNTFATQELNDWLVALDIMEPIISRTTPEIPLHDALEEMKHLDIEHMPVVGPDNKFAGILHARTVHRQLNAEVLAKQKEADTLHIKLETV